MALRKEKSWQICWNEQTVYVMRSSFSTRQLRCWDGLFHALSFRVSTFIVLSYDCPQQDTVVQEERAEGK